MTARIRHHQAPNPSGCRWCGDDHGNHGWSWVASKGVHQWAKPTRDQRLARMLARRDARQFPPAWCGDYCDETRVFTDGRCERCDTYWRRVQDRLARSQARNTRAGAQRPEPSFWPAITT